MADDENPYAFADRGLALWLAITAEHDLSPMQLSTLIEACRTADRLENLDLVCRVTKPIMDTDKGPVTHPAFVEARQQGQALKQLLVALRLPDEATGKRPQFRGARGAQAPKGAGTVSSLQRAREAKGS